jgi:hypothetical protein
VGSNPTFSAIADVGAQETITDFSRLVMSKPHTPENRVEAARLLEAHCR